MSESEAGTGRAGEERIARAALSRIGEPGDVELGALVAGHGAVRVLCGIRDGTLDSRRTPHYRARSGDVDGAAELRRAHRQGIRLVCPGEPEWPPQLDDLGVAPLGLWLRGEGDLRQEVERSVALVGARACTSYGERVAAELAATLAELAATLAERGWTVVSGAAYGIDAAAHRGALAGEGVTVAVLACGVDLAYPRGNEALLRRIGAEGLIVSELPPGCSVTKGRFLTRNRVIAALTRGTVVVEAAARSGALNTAGHAEELGRQVMAVPGPVTSSASVGCHELVRTRGASLVTDAADVLDLVGVLGADESPARRGEQRRTDGLDPEALRVLDALPVRRAAPVGKLVLVAGLDVTTVLRCLGELSAAGLAEASGGGWRLVPAAQDSRGSRGSRGSGGSRGSRGGDAPGPRGA